MLRLVGKVVVAVLAAAVGAGLALQGAGLWSPRATVVVVLVVVAAVLAAGSTTASAIREAHRRRMGARRDQVDQLLTATAWAVVDATGLDFRGLGLAAYRVRRTWWWPRRRRLRRIQPRVRAKRRPTASQVAWAPGKGVIGTCVAEGQVVAQDLAADYAAVWPCSEHEWYTVVPEEIRKGLTWKEFLDVREKYEVVVATPILVDEPGGTRVAGCVALDGPTGSLARLTQDDVLGLLDSAAAGLLPQAR